MRDKALLPAGTWPWLAFVAVALMPLLMSSSWINIDGIYVYSISSLNIRSSSHSNLGPSNCQQNSLT